MPADCLVVGHFEGESALSGPAGAVDTALGGVDGVPGAGAIASLLMLGDFTGRLSEVALLYTHGQIPAPRVLVLGLGKRGELTLDRIRQVSAGAARKARDLGCKQVACAALGAFRDGIPVADAARASVEGALLGVYQFREHKGDPEPSRAIETWTLVDFDHDAAPAVEAACEKARIVADAVLLARRWVNLGPNVLSPARFADEAVEQAAQAGLRSTVFDEDALRALGMHTVLAVARGSALAPRFLTLDYAPPGAEDEAPALLLIGKGVTFDSGGYSIKPADAMITMKGDMAGAAAVICAMLAIARLKPARRVIALTPMVENMVSANAFRPGDVITSMRGLTIEITNTDAEGRLILCDALHYAKRFAPEAVVDIATLTATSALAMGDGIAATLMTNDDGLAEAIQAAGESNGERFWRMPLYPEHLERMKSEVADIKNSGGARSGLGASGSFLKRFVDGEGRYPWAHIDMAGMGIGSDTKGYLVRGGTGFGVRSLIDLALRLAR